MNGNNAFFMSSPLNYARQVAINLINMAPARREAGPAVERAALGLLDAQRQGHFDLSPEVIAGRQNVSLRPVIGGVVGAAGADVPIGAYWCPYKPPATQGSALSSVPHVDLPKANPQFRFMFTGAMNGCSLVVLNLAGKLRVYHDSLHHADTFANQQPVLRLDYCARYFNSPYFYYPSDANGGQACNFLYYDGAAAGGARWTVICQPQLSAGAGDLTGRSPMQLNPAIAPYQVPVPY